MKTFAFTADTTDAALGRLDKAVLARAPGSTRALVSAAFARGNVLVDGRPARKSDAPRPGTSVAVRDLAETADRAISADGPPPILVWSDASLLAFDKPAGQPCQPVAIGETGTLSSALLAHWPELANVGDDPSLPGLLHRLDAGTSGLVLAARTQRAFEAVRAQFTAHTAEKTYLALVAGTVLAPGGVSGHLAHSSSFRGRMRVVGGASLPGGERALFAETFYKPIGRDGSHTLLEVTIKTGVTHQIRCHLASIGHPIVGDTTYGSTEPPPAPGVHCLHALRARFVHPDTGRPIEIHTPLPPWASR